MPRCFQGAWVPLAVNGACFVATGESRRAGIATKQAQINLKMSLQKKEFMEREALIYYQVYTEIEKEVAAFAQRYNIDLEEASGRDHHLLPVPAVFLVDVRGKIQFSYANPVHQVRVEPAGASDHIGVICHCLGERAAGRGAVRG